MKTGTYNYRIRRFDGTFEAYRMPVEILDEHPNTLLVRFLHVHADGRRFGSTSWVKKRSVWVAGGAISLQRRPQISYLPYKD
jgi:hypothetical protein